MAASTAAQQELQALASSLHVTKHAGKLPISYRLAVYQQEHKLSPEQELSAAQEHLSMRAAKPWT